MSQSKSKTKAEIADFSGQVREVTVATKGGAADHGIKTITSDRTGEALRKVLPATGDRNGKC